MHILTFFGEFAVRVVLLGALGAVVAWTLRRRGADVQHAIWLLVLAGMLALPLVIAALPPLRIPPPDSVGARLAGAVSSLHASTSAGTSSSVGGDSGNGVFTATESSPRGIPLPSWRMLALAAYAAVALFFLGRVASATWRAKKVASAASRVSIDLIDELDYPRPEIRESTEVAVPFTLGWRNSVIVLPATWRQWEDFKLRSVLVHELAHIQRRDWATAVVAAINRAVFWFHPLAWWIENRLATLSEEACDARAIRFVGDASNYASVVLAFARAATHRRVAAATSMARTSKAGRRIDRILEGRVNLNPSMGWVSWTLMLVVAVPAVYGAGVFQLAAELKTAPSRYASMSHIDGVRAILADGWTLTADEAAKFETAVEREPENLLVRVRLLSYYTQYMAHPELRNKHLLWLIEHHPDSDVFQLGNVVTAIAPDYSGLNSPDIERARALWLQQTERYADNPKVLANAATVFSAPDGRIAFELLKRLRSLEPQNPEWLDWQAAVYATAVRSSFANGHPRVRMGSSAGKQTVHDGFSLPLVESRLLKSELESSPDAALIASTAEALLAEIALLQKFQNQFSADPEILASEAFARQLQLRVQQLKSR